MSKRLRTSSLSGSVPLRAGQPVRGNHMARPRGVSPWRDRWFESISLQERVSSELSAERNGLQIQAVRLRPRPEKTTRRYFAPRLGEFLAVSKDKYR